MCVENGYSALSLSLSFFEGLDLPEKRHFSSIISKLPFTSSEPDTAVIIERKQGLEKYLQVCHVFVGGWVGGRPGVARGVVRA